MKGTVEARAHRSVAEKEKTHKPFVKCNKHILVDQ